MMRLEPKKLNLPGLPCKERASCLECGELGYQGEWNKDTRGYDHWCDFCGYKHFEPEM